MTDSETESRSPLPGRVVHGGTSDVRGLLYQELGEGHVIVVGTPDFNGDPVATIIVNGEPVWTIRYDMAETSERGRGPVYVFDVLYAEAGETDHSQMQAVAVLQHALGETTDEDYQAWQDDITDRELWDTMMEQGQGYGTTEFVHFIGVILSEAYPDSCPRPRD